MAKHEQNGNSRYTPEHDALIKRLTKKDWSTYEISYQLFKNYKSLRTSQAISQRRMVMASEGRIEGRGTGKRFATQEALDWYNKEFKTEIGPSAMLELVEQKPGTKRSAKQREVDRSKKVVNGHSFNGLSAREVIGFTKTKGVNEPNPSHTVMLMRLQRLNPDVLGLFQTLLRAGVEAEKTAEDMLEELELAAQ